MKDGREAKGCNQVSTYMHGEEVAREQAVWRLTEIIVKESKMFPCYDLFLCNLVKALVLIIV